MTTSRTNGEENLWDSNHYPWKLHRDFKPADTYPITLKLEGFFIFWFCFKVGYQISLLVFSVICGAPWPWITSPVYGRCSQGRNVMTRKHLVLILAKKRFAVLISPALPCIRLLHLLRMRLLQISVMHVLCAFAIKDYPMWREEAAQHCRIVIAPDITCTPY